MRPAQRACSVEAAGERRRKAPPIPNNKAPSGLPTKDHAAGDEPGATVDTGIGSVLEEHCSMVVRTIRVPALAAGAIAALAGGVAPPARRHPVPLLLPAFIDRSGAR